MLELSMTLPIKVQNGGLFISRGVGIEPFMRLHSFPVNRFEYFDRGRARCHRRDPRDRRTDRRRRHARGPRARHGAPLRRGHTDAFGEGHHVQDGIRGGISHPCFTQTVYKITGRLLPPHRVFINVVSSSKANMMSAPILC